MHFAIDETALIILIGVVLIISVLKILFFPLSISPSLRFSKVKDLKFSSWRSRLASLPFKGHLIALVCLMIAFIDPHLLFLNSSSNAHSQEKKTEGIAIYLVLDQSSSMAQSIQAIAKIDLLKRVTKQFIIDHPSDLIGLVSFARLPHIKVPLTLDRETLLNQLDQIQVVTNLKEDGTAMGYAIYKTAHLMAATRDFANQEKFPSYTIKSAIIIVVTDGFQNPSRLDQGNRLRTLELDDAAAYAKEHNIRLYVVNIDPILATAQYAPQRRQLQAITALTGGKYELINDTQNLQEMYANIDRLEKGAIFQPAAPLMYRRFSLYPFFIALGLSCLLASLLIDNLVLKVIP